MAIIGTHDNDTLFGTEANEWLYGLNGDDLIYADEGNDIVLGGNGNDTIFGEEGNDRLYGEAGDDILIAGDGRDVLAGGAGDDLFVGNCDGERDLFLFDRGGNDVAFGFEADADMANLEYLGVRIWNDTNGDRKLDATDEDWGNITFENNGYGLVVTNVATDASVFFYGVDELTLAGHAEDVANADIIWA